MAESKSDLVANVDMGVERVGQHGGGMVLSHVGACETTGRQQVVCRSGRMGEERAFEALSHVSLSRLRL